jgi:hypothetical protein
MVKKIKDSDVVSFQQAELELLYKFNDLKEVAILIK